MIIKDDLVGSWELESWTIGYSDRDDFTSPFGEDPQGLLLYRSANCSGERAGKLRIYWQSCLSKPFLATE